jgi:hypothetical protein
METYTLDIDNEPNLRFNGELLASIASDNEAGRWTELELYRTQAGKFVCHQVGRTQWDGEVDRYTGKVCDTLQEVKDFFGHRWLAKQLYESASIEDVIDVD